MAASFQVAATAMVGALSAVSGVKGAERPTACRVCRSGDRHAIELEIARRVPVRAIAARFKPIGKDSVHKHAQRHMPAALLQAMRAKTLMPEVDLARLREEEGRSLLEKFCAQRARLYLLIEAAEATHDIHAANAVHRTLMQNLQLTGKLLGQFIEGDRVIQQNLVISPAYLELRAALMRALFHFPLARRAVLEELKKIETGAPVTPDVPFGQGVAEGLSDGTAGEPRA
jgi:hypothetical protein